MARWEIETRAAGRTAIVGFAAFILAMLIWPDWTLRFTKVLAWPVVVLIAWLTERFLVELRDDDRYVPGLFAADFLEMIGGFWYAPKRF